MLLTTPTFWRDRLKASGIHLGLSLVIALAAALRKLEAALYLPLTGRNVFWTVFLDPAKADVIGTMPLDSF
jgi:hypothetical protein